MHRVFRIVTIVLLIVVTLDFGDWPYVDEILVDVQPSAPANATTSTDSDTPVSDRSGAPEKSTGAYQLLLHLGQFALNGPIAVTPIALTQVPADVQSSIYRSVVPHRLERPPIVPSFW